MTEKLKVIELFNHVNWFSRVNVKSILYVCQILLFSGVVLPLRSGDSQIVGIGQFFTLEEHTVGHWQCS